MDYLLNSAPCGFLSFTDDGKINMVNATLLKILGYESEELQGQHIELILPITSRILFQTDVLPLLKFHGKRDEIYISLLPKVGNEVLVLINAIRHERNKQIFNDCILMPIHRRNEYEDHILRLQKAADEATSLINKVNASLEETGKALNVQQTEFLEVNTRLETLATTDELTGLKNHRAFQEALSDQIALAERIPSPLSLLIIDVDHFKSINDTFGHPAGDRYLRKIAEILQSNSRKVDFVARYGGEEFAIILPNTNQLSAMLLAEKLRKAIEIQPWVEKLVTASFGVSTLSEDISEQTQLIHSADQALYISKARGRNCLTHANDIKSSSALSALGFFAKTKRGVL
ncbi:GGDEF domain-containing protein [Methyloglobulus sp.]|uniref:sensor domain-containing diguanylate cyclase n=1 Tax=Methyloglobulus sp. TaxID=2518622 RepID=UPI0032B78720